MTLAVALMDEQPIPAPRAPASWGSWAIHPWTDPTTLATDPAIRSPQTERVLVFTSTAGDSAARVAASTVGAVRPDLSVRVVSVPCSTAVLTRAVESVPASATSGNAVHESVLRALDATTWGAWLPTVAKLETPAPTLRQHVQSWFPDDTGFLAVHGDPGWVAKLPLATVEPERRLARVPEPGVTASAYECHAFGELPEPAIAALFAMGLASRPVRRVPVAESLATWGTAKAVEFVVTRPVGDLEPAPEQCRSCGEPFWRSACIFCRSRDHRAGTRFAPVRGATS